MLGNMKVSQVKLYNIQSMMNELSKTLSSATVQKIKHTLHQMFAQAVRLQYMHRNPVDGVETPALRQKDRAIIPEKDILRMTQFCRTYEHGALIMTLLYTGLRRGEILALTKADVDLENSSITVNKAVEFVGDMPNIKEPKTPRSNRRVPILDALLPYLIVLINDKEDTAPLFTNADGELHTKSSIKCLFRDFNKKYNAYINLNKSEDAQETVHFTMHQFRHTFCTLLYRAGIDVKAAQEMLGHSSVNVTLGIYTHLDNKLRQFNTDKINEFISSQSKVSQTAI